MSKKTVIVIGKSGAGKSTFINKVIESDSEFKECEIYSTRESRGSTDSTIHMDIETMKKEDGFMFKAEATDDYYLIKTPSDDKHFITAIISQANAALYKRYLENKGINTFVIEVFETDEVCVDRLRARGDDEELIQRRLDASKFGEIDVNQTVHKDTDIEKIINKIKDSNMQDEVKMTQEELDENLDKALMKLDNVFDTKVYINTLAERGANEKQIYKTLVYLIRSISPVFMGDTKYKYRDEVIKCAYALAEAKQLEGKDKFGSFMVYMNILSRVISNSVDVVSVTEALIEDKKSLESDDTKFLLALSNNIHGINMIILSDKLMYSKMSDNEDVIISEEFSASIVEYLENGTNDVETAINMSTLIKEITEMKKGDELYQTIKRLRGNQLIEDNGDDIDLLFGMVTVEYSNYKEIINALLDAIDKIGEIVNRDFMAGTLILSKSSTDVNFIIEKMNELKTAYAASQQ